VFKRHALVASFPVMMTLVFIRYEATFGHGLFRLRPGKNLTVLEVEIRSAFQ